MNVSQIVNYYPKYAYLDNVLATTANDKLCLIVDLKGCMQSLYQEWAQSYIVEQSRGVKFVDCSIFGSLLEFIAFHKRYAKKRDIQLQIHFFYEQGSSDYHLRIDDKYKSRRKSKNYFGLDTLDVELFTKVYDKNLDIIHKVCNKIPGVYVLELQYVEADFMPWYIINRTNMYSEDVTYIIYSQDKDMLQCLDKENIFIYYKHYKTIKMVSHNTVFEHFFKTESAPNIGAEYFPMVLSIVGDSADDIPGIKGIGMKRCLSMLEAIKEHTGSMDTVYDRLHNDQQIFDSSFGTNIKYGNLLIEQDDRLKKNLRLTSYQLISEFIDSGYPTQNIARQKYIVETLSNKRRIKDPQMFFNSLCKAGLAGIITENTITDLF